MADLIPEVVIALRRQVIGMSNDRNVIQKPAPPFWDLLNTTGVLSTYGNAGEGSE